MRVSILGNRVIRTEDPRFLTTGGVYTDDVTDEQLAGACHVHFVRSAVAHARIGLVDVSAALEAPGVIAAFTGADLADLPLAPPPMAGMINAQMGQPLLATDVVRYVGEPLAVVVTENRYQGEDAADLVDVDYDVLPPVVDMAGAAASETVLFPAAGSNVAATFGDAAALAADLFDGCEVVVSRTIVNQRVAPAPMETRAAAAAWAADGKLTAWIPNQGAQGTRAALAGMLGIDRATLRVITPDVGGAFGAKFGADPEHAVVCWVARRLGRPARWAETRNENLIGMTHGRAQRQTITIGGSRDGKVAAYRLEILQDSGAYPKFGAFLPELTILMAPGPYALPRAEAVATSVVTNTTPVGAYRGAGRPEATAAVERAIDLFAAEADTETGKAALRRVVTVDDAGTVINPLLAEGQRHGGIAQGAAQALLEEVVYDADGNPLTASFADYPFVSAAEVPSFELAEMETPTSYNPLGAKGIGEAGTIGSTPAVQNAIVDAVAPLGVRHIDMPASPQRVWQALREAAAPRLQVIGVLAEFPVGDVPLEALDLVALVGQERGDEVPAEDVGQLAVGLQRIQGIGQPDRQDLGPFGVISVPLEFVRRLDLVRDAEGDGGPDGRHG